ncbi:MAG TPA: hypothetical protein VFF11_04200 [Candidatus Binatia bacterium]|nr:hypothetical protein [Candidatus Binatia bacterium]
MQISKFPLWLCALTLCGGMTLRAEDTAAQAAARAALEQKMQELGGNSSAAPETAAPAQTAPAETAPAQTITKTPAVSTPAPAATAPAAVETTAPATGTPMAAGSGDTPAQAAARAAVEQKLQQLGGYAPASSPAASGAVPEAVSSERQIIAPPPPVNMSKAEKLHWLLSLYISNQISPKQYQEQRAAILADH